HRTTTKKQRRIPASSSVFSPLLIAFPLLYRCRQLYLDVLRQDDRAKLRLAVEVVFQRALDAARSAPVLLLDLTPRRVHQVFRAVQVDEPTADDLRLADQLLAVIDRDQRDDEAVLGQATPA